MSRPRRFKSANYPVAELVMRLSREQVELIAEAVRESDADEFKLDLTTDGKLRFSSVALVEREHPISLTKLRAAKNGRRESASPVA